MSEGQDTGATAEPSMEEILASIRKIISDDSTPSASGASESFPDSSNDDVIELTQMVQDDGSVVDVKPVVAAEPPPSPPPPPTPAKSASPSPVSPPVQSLSSVAEKVVSQPQERNLVSDTTVSSSASSLSALANTVEIERLSSAPQMGTGLGNGTRTLEDMVIELMRPMLKEWLEHNLPATVDRLVQKEIERISRKVV